MMKSMWFAVAAVVGSSCAGASTLQVRPVDIYTRVTASCALPSSDSIEMRSWRNERVHAQIAVSCAEAVKGVSVSVSDLVSSEGASIPGADVKCRFVRSVPVTTDAGLTAVPDVLDNVPSRDFGKGETVGAWITVTVPAAAAVGKYEGKAIVSAGNGEQVSVPVVLRVLDRPALPDVRERKFFLDIWQHPWRVATYYGVEPYSKEHYDRLEPIYRELAAAGQKVILTSIVDLPWGEHYGNPDDEIRTMVKYVKGRDGRFKADFSRFDEYVAFARRCGLGPQIHCYTVVKFNNKHIFYYHDERTGERRAEELYEGTRAYEEFLTPLLVQLQEHLVAKGWIDDAYIAIDEVPPERLVKPREFLKRVAPRLKFAVASNVEPLRYRGLEKDIDVFSQILWHGHGITSIDSRELDEFTGTRRVNGRTTTIYVCTQPQHPNTWLKSPLAETAWIGLYAAAKRFDGFLRWAGFLWGKDPFDHTVLNLGNPAGEDTLLYPDGLVSVRWEILRDSIENWEKIRLLRESKTMSPQLTAALGAYSYEAMRFADETDYRHSVRAVVRELDRDETDPPVDSRVSAWEGGRRAQTLEWFRREFYGRSPGRPADQRIVDDGVELDGGKIKLRVHATLPEGASADDPVPVFMLCDHFYGLERADGRWTRPTTPTNMIVSRGYAFVNINFNDIALNCYDKRWTNLVHRVYGCGKPDDWGTLSAWAWGVSRAVDWIETRPELDASRIAVTGHSRGGKAALWAAAQDRRIAMAVPNGSGTGGARLMNMYLAEAEPLKWMLNHTIRFWFAVNALKYIDSERHLPYDADDLIRLVAPRLAYVSSGSKDVWAGPEGEFESARRASDIWRAYGLPGLGIDEYPAPGEWSHEGRVGFHLHDGPHQLEPWDWERFLDFADKHMKKGRTVK